MSKNLPVYRAGELISKPDLIVNARCNQRIEDTKAILREAGLLME